MPFHKCHRLSGAGVETIATMSDIGPKAIGPATLTLDHLIALNDEIAALARAGLPLEGGFRPSAATCRGS